MNYIFDIQKTHRNPEKAGAVCVKFHAISPLSGSITSPKFNNVIVHSG